METQIIKISKIWLSICHICQKWPKLATLIPLVFRAWWPLAAFKIKRPPNEGYCFLTICSSEASFDFLSEQKLCWLSEAFVFNNQRVLAGTCHRGFLKWLFCKDVRKSFKTLVLPDNTTINPPELSPTAKRIFEGLFRMRKKIVRAF